MWGRATFTTVASRLAMALAPTVAARAMRPLVECRTSWLATPPDAVSMAATSHRVEVHQPGLMTLAFVMSFLSSAPSA